MSYTIYNTDGTILLTLAEGKIDQKTTSLTLIGRNVNSYGEYFNNNLIKLLENFAGQNEPTSPVTGQLWYDLSSGRLKIYDLNNSFRPISNTFISDTQPLGITTEDFWFDTTNDQLYIAVDNNTLSLIGPQNSSIYGPTGWVAETILDNVNNSVDITSLYSTGKQVGVFSTVTVTLSTPIAGFSTLNPGLQLINGLKFYGTATSADSVAGISVSKFLRNDINQTTLGAFSVQNNLGFTVANSALESISMYVDTVSHIGTLAYNPTNADFRIQITNSDTGLTDAVYIDSMLKNVGIWNDTPTYPLDVVGDTRIQGNLYVVGNTTNVESVNLQINDKNIELGFGQGTPSDTFVDGGGITLHGTTDHIMAWTTSTGWNFNDHVNIDAGFSYKVNGNIVLSENSLSSSITTASGITTLGTLAYLTVTNVYISGNTVSAIGTNKTLILSANGTGTVSSNNIRLTEVGAPVNNTDAATKKYVDDSLYLVGTKSFALTLDVTGFATAYGSTDIGVKYFLDQAFPITNSGLDAIFNIPDGVRAKVICGTTTIPTLEADVDINYASTLVDKNGVVNSELVVSGLAGAVVGSLPPQTYTPVTTYTVQTWKTQIGAWTKIS